jgi:hypothetical protein
MDKDNNEYYNGRGKIDENGTAELRVISVYVASSIRGLKDEVAHENIHMFEGTILNIGDDDNLILRYSDRRVFTLIPWNTIRFITSSRFFSKY